MALPTASDNQFPKVILEEVANDGSATTTPAADHRSLFLGEDGALHLKDSAAAVTDIVSASTHIADASDAHDASAVSVLDTAANFTGTDVEAVLAELQDNIDAVGGAVGGVWEMKKDSASAQTMTNNTDTQVTFEGTGVDSGGSVVDLANDRFVAPATGLYLAICAPQYTATTLPTNACYVTPKVGGSDVTSRIIKGVAPTVAGGIEGTRTLSLTSGDFVTMWFNPGAVTGCTLRGSTSVQLQTRFMLVRIT